MKTLFIFNDAPFSGERTYNGLRVAWALSKQEGNSVTIFLFGDAAPSALIKQQIPQGFGDVGEMLGNVIQQGGKVAICATCMEARNMLDNDVMAGTRRGTMAELTEWIATADKVLVF
ncbi:MAG: DsrE family protein [Gallionellaceae bacterium]